jgi:hypothetical protein
MHDSDSDLTICNINAITLPPIYKSWNPLPSFDCFQSVLIELEADGVLIIDNASTDGRNYFAFISANDEAWVCLLSRAIHAQANKLKDSDIRTRRRMGTNKDWSSLRNRIGRELVST